MFFLKVEIGWVDKIVRELMAVLCQLIYPLISWLYDLFMKISQVNILSSEDVQPIYQRITLILTIVMVFYVTFQFVKFVVQPDGITDKEKGVANIVYKMVIVVVLIAFVPSIFEWAFKLQNAIIKDGIIGNIIVGIKEEIDPDKLGKTFSSNIFSMFYGVDAEYEEEECDGIKCGTLVAMNLSALGNRGELTYITKGLAAGIEVSTEVEDEKATMPLIKFDGLLAVAVGCFMVYILAMYCIDVGARWAQLIFLQIIAPIPIIGYLSPKKDGMFQKWCKQCMTTYLDLFIRIAIIYFILLICATLLESRITGDLLKGLGELSPTMEAFIYIVLVMGVLMFAKKAPKMLSELFPSSGAAAGNFGLSSKDRLSPSTDLLKGIGKAARPIGRVAGAAAGAVTGAAAGLASGVAHGLRKAKSKKSIGGKAVGGTFGAVWGGIRGVVGGTARGLINGGKKGNVLKNSLAGAKQQVKSNKRFGNKAEQGYGIVDQVGDTIRKTMGLDSRKEMQESKKAAIARQDDAIKRVTDTESKIKTRALEKRDGELKSNEAKGAAATLSAAETKLKELQDPSIQGKYVSGKYSQDDATKAQEDYAAAVLLAKSSVNRSNFVDQNGNFDQKGYEAAVNAAVSQVNVNNYTVAYKDESSAQKAYDTAVSLAQSSIKLENFTDRAAYELARTKAAESVNRNLFIVGYETEDAAKAARGLAIQEAMAEVDERQKDYVAAYAAHEGDNAITQTIDELETYLTGYNTTTVDSSRHVNVDTETIAKDFKRFSQNVKRGAIRELIDANAKEKIKVETEIGRIERQTKNTEKDSK